MLASQVAVGKPPPLAASMGGSSARSKRASPNASRQRRSPAAKSGATIRNRLSATPVSRSIRQIGRDDAADAPDRIRLPIGPVAGGRLPVAALWLVVGLRLRALENAAVQLA